MESVWQALRNLTGSRCRGQGTTWVMSWAANPLPGSTKKKLLHQSAHPYCPPPPRPRWRADDLDEMVADLEKEAAGPPGA